MTGSEARQSAEYMAVIEASKKMPHELVQTDLPDWYMIETIQRDFYMRGVKYPSFFESPLIYALPPIGAYKSFTQDFPHRELYLARLELVRAKDLILDPVRRYSLEWDELTTTNRKRLIQEELEFFGQFLPLTAYRDAKGRLISKDGSYHILVAEELGIETVLCWVIETKGGFAMNRHRYVQEALEKGLQVSDDAISNIPLSAPLLCPNYTAKELATVYSATVGDRLDAIYKAIDGDLEPLQKIEREDAEWEQKLTR